MEFKTRDFRGFNALWNYMIVNAPVEDLHNPPQPIGIFTPKSQRGKRGEINNIHNVVNSGIKALNIFKALWKAINVFKHNRI